MHRILILFIWGFFIHLSSLAQEVTEVRTDIDSVKLHLTGAEVFRNKRLVLDPGRNSFVFSDLSSKLYPQSIQVSPDIEGVKVISVSSKTNFLRKSKEDKRITQLRDSIEIVRRQIQDLNDERSAYMEERELLVKNRDFKGNDKTLTVVELKDAADFFRERMHTINKATTRLDRAISKANRRLFDQKLQLRELNAKQDPTSEIVVVLESPRATQVGLTLRYVVSDAGWAAIYDLEAGELENPISLKYRALAFNNTGVEWNDIKLTLSTKDPLQTANRPQLTVWSLDDYSTGQINEIANLDINIDVDANIYNQSIGVYNKLELDAERKKREVKEILGEDYSDGVDYETDMYRRYRADKANAPRANKAMLDVPEFVIDFEIDEPFSIPSDAKPYSIDIMRHELDVTYKYFAVPKLDRDAFLLAQIVGWEDLDLISGPVNIYHGKKFIGQSHLDIRNLSDTLEVSLGRDQNVVVSRVKIKGKTRRQILGGMKKAAVAYNISARNNHDKPIQIEIQDQVPISSDKEVMITIDEMSGAEYEEKIGNLSWTFGLQPGETKTMEFGFTIKYPKNKSVRIEYKKSNRMEQMRMF